jgi:hypothetical protein
VGYKELKKNGAFLLPGFAKFVVIRKPATKERAGINPSGKFDLLQRRRRRKYAKYCAGSVECGTRPRMVQRGRKSAASLAFSPMYEAAKPTRSPPAIDM